MHLERKKKLLPHIAQVLREWSDEDLDRRFVAVLPEKGAVLVVLIPKDVVFAGGAVPMERESKLKFGLTLTRLSARNTPKVSPIMGEDSSDVALTGLRMAVEEYLTACNGTYERSTYVFH